MVASRTCTRVGRAISLCDMAMPGKSQATRSGAKGAAPGVGQRRGLILAGMVFALVLAATALWSNRDASWDRVRDAGVVRIGYALEAPYAFMTEAGRVTGEAPEIARQVAQRLGLAEPEWILTDFNRLIPELQAHRFDVIAAGLFITPERERVVAFSRPTAQVQPGMLVRRGNPSGLVSYADAAARSDVKLVALAGSVEARELAQLGVPTERLIISPDTISGLSLLRTGKVQGLALSLPTVRWMASSPDTNEWAQAVAMHAEGKGAQVAFAFRQADQALREKWDGELAGFLGGAEHGLLEREFGLGAEAKSEARP